MIWQPPALNIIEVIQSPSFIGDTDISPAQVSALKAAYGLPMSSAELDFYKVACEKAVYRPSERREVAFICGRRSGKDDKLASSIVIYESLFRSHKLNRGERGVALLLAATREQARICFSYIRAKLESSPLLANLIVDIRDDEIDLANGVSIAVLPANFRTVRGRSVICCVCSEIAFWHDNDTGSNPAKEILKAVRPSMATFPSSKLIMASSPFSKSGVLFEMYKKRHDIDWGHKRLVWKLDSLSMNPSLDRERLREEETADPENYRREYLAEFWESTSTFLSPAAIDACVLPQRFVWLPQPEFRYYAALDAAFRSDAFAFSIVHTTPSGDVVQDMTISWHGSRAEPVQLATVLDAIVEQLKLYKITTIFGDQFASEPIRQALAAKGVEFIQRQTLGARAGCMSTLRTLVASRKIALLDDAETIAELKNLQVNITASGNIRIEAAGSAHDDRVVSLALAAHECVSQPRLHAPILTFVSFDERSANNFAHRSEEDLRSLSREDHFFNHGSSFR